MIEYAIEANSNFTDVTFLITVCSFTRGNEINSWAIVRKINDRLWDAKHFWGKVQIWVFSLFVSVAHFIDILFFDCFTSVARKMCATRLFGHRWIKLGLALTCCCCCCCCFHCCSVVVVVITGFNQIPSWPQINQVVTCIGLLLHYFSWEANYCQ